MGNIYSLTLLSPRNINYIQITSLGSIANSVRYFLSMIQTGFRNIFQLFEMNKASCNMNIVHEVDCINHSTMWDICLSIDFRFGEYFCTYKLLPNFWNHGSLFYSFELQTYQYILHINCL